MNMIFKDLKLESMRSEYEARWLATADEMRRRGIDSAVVWSRGAGTFERFQDTYYLTNYYSCNSGCGEDWMQRGTRAAGYCAVILRAGREPILIADDPTVDVSQIAAGRVVAETDVVAAVARTMVEERLKGEVALVGSECITAKHFRELQELTPGVHWSGADDLVLDVRVIKSPYELDLFREGGKTVTNAMNAMFETVQNGGSEADGAGAAAREVYLRQGNINFCHLGHGKWTAERMTDQPMSGYSTRTPAKGDLLRGWVYGAMHKGYWLDPGRTTVVGLNPTPEQRFLVESGAEYVEKLRALIRPGQHVKAVAMEGRRLRNQFNGETATEGDWFEIFGHGNGLFWEPPVIDFKYDGKHSVFAPGMVATAEIFLELPGVGMAGFGQNFIVTAEGTELLTKTPLLWW